MQRSSRRKTLGPISTNGNTSRRKSVEPSNGAASKLPKPPRGRASMIPRVGRENSVPVATPSRTSFKKHSTPTNRRFSSGGEHRQSLIPASAVVVRSDPRPLSDKAFQHTCIKRLLKFLVDHGYDHPISQKALTRPSGKDFNNIVTFLFRRIDPNFQDGSMKIEDEIAMSFRAIGYPFSVSKTALVAAGSPHTWPTLLGALCWLLERISYLEKVSEVGVESQTFESLEELESKTDKVFFKYLSSAYTAFLRGDEHMTETLEVALAERFEKDDEIIENEIEQMSDKNSIVLEQISNLSSGDNELKDLQNKRNGYITDLEQFHDLIDQMESHVSSLHQKKRETEEELGDSKTELEVTTRVLESLRDSVRSQELCLDDVRSMQNEAKGMAEAIERARGNRDGSQHALSKKTAALENLSDNIESSVARCNARGRNISLASSNAEAHVGGKKIELQILLETTDLTIFSESTSFVLSAKDEQTVISTRNKLNYQARLDELEHSEGSFSEALQRLRIVEEKMEMNDAVHDSEQKTFETKVNVRLREAESIETTVSSLRDPLALEEQMAQYERQCAELEALKIKDNQENTSRVRSLCSELNNAVLAIQSFDKLCESKIDEIAKYREGRVHTLTNCFKVPI